MRFLFLMNLAACEPVSSTGRPFAPLPPEAPVLPPIVAAPPAQAPGPAPQAVAEGRFDFEAQERAEPVAEAGDSLSAQALVVTSPTPPVVALGAPSAPLPVGWGVRLVATVTDAVPPRAVLALPNGVEVVVEPGTLLPEAHIVVLAIGRDSVELAEILPAGFYATVRTYSVRALFPAER